MVYTYYKFIEAFLIFRMEIHQTSLMHFKTEKWPRKILISILLILISDPR